MRSAKRYLFVRRVDDLERAEPASLAAHAVAAPYVTRLLNPAYVAIHRANRRALVAGGVTAPRGNTGGYGPLAWVRGMAAAHAKLDAYAHNPYATRPRESPFRGACPYCDVISMANLNRLTKEVHRDFGRTPIWLTEFGYQTNPPDHFGVSPSAQAQYVGEAALRAFQLPGVTILIQFLVRDEPNWIASRAGFSPFTARPSRPTPPFGSPWRRSRGTARARRCGARFGRARARGPTACRSVGDGGWRWLGGVQRTNGADSSPRP